MRHALVLSRGSRRRREVALDDAAAIPDDALTSDARADVGIDAGDLERALLALPDGLRVVFVLKQVEGYSHDEIGATLGISAGASRVRLARALDALRRALR